MIKSFRNKALERLWWRGETRRIDPRHVKKVCRRLGELEAATEPGDMNLPGYRLHSLTGDQAGRYAIRVDENWRLTFAWDDAGPHAIDVDYEDDH